MKARPSKPAIMSISCAILLVSIAVLANSSCASANSGEVKTIQQLRSHARSNEHFRSKTLDESSVLMAKTSPIVPLSASTEGYAKTTLQMVVPRPTNATLPEPSDSVPTSGGALWASRIKRLIQSKGFQRMVMGNFMNTTSNVWHPTGNDLWDGIIGDCIRKPSFSCMQKNMYSYLDRTLLASDLNVTDNFLFIKNKVNFTEEFIRTNEIDDLEDSANDPDSQGRAYQSEENDTIEAGETTCPAIESCASELRE